MLPAQARLRRRPEFTAVVRSGRRVGRPTMVLHYLPQRPPVPSGGADHGRAPAATSRKAIGRDATGCDDGGSGPRAGFVVGRTVGNSVVRHRVTRRLRAVVRGQLDRLPPTADLVVRARPEAAAATSRELDRDLRAGLDRVLTPPAGRQP